MWQLQTANWTLSSCASLSLKEQGCEENGRTFSPSSRGVGECHENRFNCSIFSMKLKMKYNFLFLMMISIFLISCQSVNEKKVLRFKNYVGHENFEATDNFLKLMEGKLEETYSTGNLGGNMDSYLEDVVSGKSKVEFTKEDCKVYELYKLSGMENKWSLNKYDSVYIDTSGIFITKYYKGEFEEDVIIGKTPNDYKIDSMRNSLAPLEYIHDGKLNSGLEHIAESDSVIIRFVEHRKMVGNIPPSIFAQALIDEKNGFDFEKNYFYRLFVLVEIFLTELNQFDCD